MRPEGYERQGPRARRAFDDGEAMGMAQAVLEALEVRGLELSGESRARILSCTDIGQLRTWLRRAVTVWSIEGLFSDWSQRAAGDERRSEAAAAGLRTRGGEVRDSARDSVHVRDDEPARPKRSAEHRKMVILFRECPELAVQLLRGQPGVSLASAVHAVDGSAGLGPTESAAHPVVAVVELFGTDESRPVQAIVVEVAVRVDPVELASWRVHVARVHAQLGCPVCLLVVAERAGLAEGARQPLEIGPGSSLTPVVVGPDEMPAVTDIEQARRAPEFAALSAILHGRDRDVKRAAAIAMAATEAMLVFDRSRWMTYRTMIAASLSRRASEELLAMRLEAHRRRGRTPHKACAEAVLEVLNARGLAVSMADRERILALPELATLRGWLRRAVVAERTSDVFAN